MPNLNSKKAEEGEEESELKKPVLSFSQSNWQEK